MQQYWKVPSRRLPRCLGAAVAWPRPAIRPPGFPIKVGGALLRGGHGRVGFDASGHTIALAQAVDPVTIDAGCVEAVERAISAHEQLRA
jgi:hypothetical protein